MDDVRTRTMNRWGVLPLGLCLCGALFLGGCSAGQMIARTTTPVIGGGVEAMNRESDLDLARAAIPANLKLVEGLLVEDPANLKLRQYAAEGFYGYAFGFVEDEDQARASLFYERCLGHAQAGLRVTGLRLDPRRVGQQELEAALVKLEAKAVPSLFWAASCWAKWIDMTRDEPARVAEAARAAALMARVLSLDENYYYGGPDLFFGVYYASRPPMLGGDYAKAEDYFAKARAVTDGKLLIVDVLYAQYLARQRLDRRAFHQRLMEVLGRRADVLPEMVLANTIAQRKARQLLAKEAEWF
jgi:hypothetical protein